MATFNVNDKYDKSKAYTGVVWGERSKILEVELNEMQKILSGLIQDVAVAILRPGFIETPSLSYSAGTLTIPSCHVMTDLVFKIEEPMSISGLADGAAVYLAYKEETYAHDDTIKKGGNLSGGSTLTDTEKGIIDPRLQEETSRRRQGTFQLTTDNSDTSFVYLPVGRVAGTSFTDERVSALAYAGTDVPNSFTADQTFEGNINAKGNVNIGDGRIAADTFRTHLRAHKDRFDVISSNGSTLILRVEDTGVFQFKGDNVAREGRENVFSAKQTFNGGMDVVGGLIVDGVDLKQSVSDGKAGIATAITDMGQTASGSDTFPQLEAAIRNISKDATAQPYHLRAGQTAYVGGQKITGTIEERGGEWAADAIGSEGNVVKLGIPDAAYYFDSAVITAESAHYTPDSIRVGRTIFGKAGTFTSDATAAASQILAGETAYVNGSKVTGSMPNRGSVSQTLASQGQSYTIPSGYHSGSGKVTANITNLSAGNIRDGVSVGGVAGSFTANATAYDLGVLSGLTYGHNGTMRTGTMADRSGAHVTGQAISRSGTTLRIRPQRGYYDGGTSNSVQYSDADWIESNIREGINIFGKTGTLKEGAPFATGTVSNVNSISVSGLGFQPQYVVAYKRGGSGDSMTVFHSSYGDIRVHGTGFSTVRAYTFQTNQIIQGNSVVTINSNGFTANVEWLGDYRWFAGRWA